MYKTLFLSYHIILLFFVISFIYIMYFMDNINSNNYRYKIKYFYLNSTFIFMYIFFWLVFWFRIQLLAENTDLKLLLYKINMICYTANIILLVYNYILIFLSIISLLYLFKLLTKFFYIQVKARFLLYNNFLTKFDFRKYNLMQLCVNMQNVFFNNGRISALFYKYLLFYFIYYNYKNLSCFLDNTYFTLNRILFNMYYKEKTVKYVNIPKNYQQVMRKYIEQGLFRDINKNPEPLLDDILGEFSYNMQTYYELNTIDGFEYINKANQCFFEESNDKEDTVLFDYLSFYKKLNNFFNDILFSCIANPL